MSISGELSEFGKQAAARRSGDEFRNLLDYISAQLANIRIDWDELAGEQWATIYQNGEVLGYFHCVLPIAFSKVEIAWSKRGHMAKKGVRYQFYFLTETPRIHFRISPGSSFCGIFPNFRIC